MFDSPLARRRLQLAIQQDPLTLARLAGLQGGMVGMAGMPQGAMTLAQLAQPEPPQMVTPAAPAPMQPGREIVAPPVQQPPAQQQPQEEELYVAPVGPGVSKKEAVPTTPEAVQGMFAMQAADIADRIRKAGVVSPEMEQIFTKREQRYGEELERLKEDEKKAGWLALAEAGFRMAQSQSPYFMSALAEGMQAGLTGFNAKKAAAAERKARLQTAQEDVALGRIAAKEAASTAEQQRVNQELTYRNLLMQGYSQADALALLEQTRDARLRNAQLQPALTEAEIAQKLIGAEASMINATRPTNTGDGGFGLPSGYATLRNSIVSQMRLAQSVASDLTQSQAARDEAKNQLTILQGQLQGLDAQIGAIPGGSPLGGGVPGAPLPISFEEITPGGKAQKPAAQKPAAPAQPPKPPAPPVDPNVAISNAIRKAQAEARQYQNLPRGSTGLIRLSNEKGDIRKANNAAIAAAKSSGLPQYQRRQGETSAQYDRRVRRALNLPEVD